ncbi:carbamoyltransferase HypF [Glaciimonas sp. PCH181]|uniref:carbamoyltransferase HypF n=1 Tax=Glaciimonas sp. PCH181 TaxID=2133943 RepID=UPI000D35ABF9|nr:carbamoyltransferase HypF [Glaciimonas sp. PCH181]PUA18920.1 carbamoyltransferase HypF [Glaciimonas sp. PCH181]
MGSALHPVEDRMTKTQTAGEEIRVRGLVQGVGFRPNVWRLACECNLVGEVHNDSDGVLIHAWGEQAMLNQFVQRISTEAPPLAHIVALERRRLTGIAPAGPFRITASSRGRIRTGIVPDAAACAACIDETFNPAQRRYRYPFTNCTHCGPRLSIVQAIPYDRDNTSMGEFAMCADCRAEYTDPLNRRFHAQPIACPQCGPRVWLVTNDGSIVLPEAGEDAIGCVQHLLLEGQIVAIKGLGGFHLACDATNAEAVSRLRKRKHRDHKAFALMARDLAMVENYCKLSAGERKLLASPAAPIVLCDALHNVNSLPEAIAPGLTTLGFMLPYTPLHHLLMDGLDRPIVLSSGNLSDEPQCTTNQDAQQRLAGIADYLLLHDRDIVNRLDDSVVRFMDGTPHLLRRARGYAPAPLPLPPGFKAAPPILAMGGALKNTFCLIAEGQAILSPHQGDLEDAATQRDYGRNLALFRHLYEHGPKMIAVDNHPDYASTRRGLRLAEQDGLPIAWIQHHHAHVASCLAENGQALNAPPVLGIVLDGMGMGEENELWGGEFLLADYRAFRRLARFKPIALIGGEKAMHEPWRCTYAHLAVAIGWPAIRDTYGDLALTRFMESKPLATLDAMLAHGINCPVASSCGRLFDAVAGAIDVCRERTSYEGQAAIALEGLATNVARQWADNAAAYPFALTGDGDGDGEAIMEIDPASMWQALLRDLADHTAAGIIAARFHFGLAKAVVDTARRCAASVGPRSVGPTTVALSGGVFQNRILFEQVALGLRVHGFTVLSQQQVPANDGGLSLGQAAIAAARAIDVSHRMHNGGKPCA